MRDTENYVEQREIVQLRNHHKTSWHSSLSGIPFIILLGRPESNRCPDATPYTESFSGNLPWHSSFLLLFFNWGTSVSFCCTAKWFSPTYTYNPSSLDFLPIQVTGEHCRALGATQWQSWRSSIQSAKIRPGADCGSDHELLIAKFQLKLKKVGKPLDHSGMT